MTKEIKLVNGSVVLGLIDLEMNINQMIGKMMTEGELPDDEISQETLDMIQKIIQDGVTQILTPVDLASIESLIRMINVDKESK